MRKILRVSVAALAVTTTLTLAGCGRSDTPPAENKTAAPVAAGKAKGTIKVWAMGTEGDKLSEFAKGFTKENPDAKVEVTSIPWDAAHDKISTAIAAKQTPDLSLIGTTWMGEFASSGALDAVPAGIDPGTFYDGAWGTTEVGGTAYAVPWYVETRVLYTNNAVAKKAGVSTTPATWDDFAANAKKMQASGAKFGTTIQAGQTGAWQTLLPFVWQAGGQVISKDGKKLTLDTPEFVKALTFYQSFFTDKVAPTDVPVGTMESDFNAGKIGSFVSGPWHMGILKDAGNKDFTVAPLPAGKQKASFMGGSDVAVFKSAKNRDAAWKFIQWLSKPETQVAWYKTTSDLPAVSSAWDTGALATDPQLKVFGTQLKSAVAPPSIPNWEQIAAVIDTELEKVCKSGLDPQQAATAIQKQADAIGTGL
ncbi:sugar ABC transporter substrate-binding protein [Pengzhenrongella sp.]|jgi:multiple sugar transport system substrate-binding protein|uniref:sugar ABC transporter substrate-binding protein n=1 Tax=Pengzhenrongella sp. TaxID=2888820 RepID=UPI002F952FBB